MIKEELIMEKIEVNFEELNKEKKEMEDLLQKGKEIKKNYLKMMDDLNRQLEKLVAIKERY